MNRLSLQNHPNGQVAIQGLRLEDSPTGDWTEWYDDGTVKATYTFFDGLEHGSARMACNGRVSEQSHLNLVFKMVLSSNGMQMKQVKHISSKVYKSVPKRGTRMGNLV